MNPIIEQIFTPPQSDEPKAFFVPGMSMEEYRAMPALNASTLKEETAAEMKVAQLGEDEEESDPPEATAQNLALGTCIHKAILEPEAFDSNDWQSWFHFSPTKGVTTKAAKELKLTLESHVTIITPEMLDIARKCRDIAHADPDVAYLLKSADKELTGKAWDEDLRIWRKCRFDVRGGEGSDYLADVKSLQSLNLEAFLRQIRTFRWDIQASYYIDTEALISQQKRERFFFIGITKKRRPFLVRVFEVPQGLIEEARADYLEKMAAYIKAAKTNRWEGYSGITMLPHYQRHRRA